MTPEERKAAKARRDAARARIRADAATRRAEMAARAAEELAPLAQRVPVLDAAGGLLRAPRLVVLDGRVIHHRPLDLNRAQRRAADRFRADWDEAQTISAGVARLTGVASGSTPSAAPDAGVVRQLAVRARLEGAMAWAGAFLPALLLVVAGRAPVSEWAKESGQSAEDAAGWVRAGLDRLVKYYDSGNRPRQVIHEIVTFGPERGEYEV